tara:strand:- start:18 stop:1040 length:1023 start_codon:yes stop_codon:yes gene_type:complete
MAVDKKEDDKPELEIVETDEAGKPLTAAEGDKSDEGGDDDKKLSLEGDEGEERDEVDTDPEREKLRQERKLRRKIQKELRREQMREEREELKALRIQTRDLEHKLNYIQAGQNSGVEQTLKEKRQGAISAYQQADQDVGLAIEASDGIRAREALKRRDDAKEFAQQIDMQLRRMQTQPTNVGTDPVETAFYKEWTKKNSWFDPKLGNDESRIARQINDDLINKDGYKPNTEAFWAELTKRVSRFVKPEDGDGGDGKRRASEKDDDADAEERLVNRRRGGPPVNGGGRESPSTNKSRERVFVTPARKQALIEAGHWDDPAMREKYLRAYQKYDRAQSTNAR